MWASRSSWERRDIWHVTHQKVGTTTGEGIRGPNNIASNSLIGTEEGQNSYLTRMDNQDSKTGISATLAPLVMRGSSRVTGLSKANQATSLILLT